MSQRSGQHGRTDKTDYSPLFGGMSLPHLTNPKSASSLSYPMRRNGNRILVCWIPMLICAGIDSISESGELSIKFRSLNENRNSQSEIIRITTMILQVFALSVRNYMISDKAKVKYSASKSQPFTGVELSNSRSYYQVCELRRNYSGERDTSFIGIDPLSYQMKSLQRHSELMRTEMEGYGIFHRANLCNPLSDVAKNSCFYIMIDYTIPIIRNTSNSILALTEEKSDSSKSKQCPRYRPPPFQVSNQTNIISKEPIAEL